MPYKHKPRPKTRPYEVTYRADTLWSRVVEATSEEEAIEKANMTFQLGDCTFLGGTWEAQPGASSPGELMSDSQEKDIPPEMLGR